MAEKLSKRIITLENKVRELLDKTSDLQERIDNKRNLPETKVSQLDLSKIGRPLSSIGTGLGRIFGMIGNIIWNDADAKNTPFGTQPSAPNKGYNKHGHSKFSGGALDVHILELVEYETQNPNVEDPVILDSNGQPVNKHSQAYWKNHPKIAKDGDVEKIGMLDISFDSSSKKWIAGGGANIDVEKTYLIQYVWIKDGDEVPAGTEGAVKEIKKDENENEMKSPLLYTLGDTSTIAGRNENLNKSNVYWDKNAQCWRFYAVFKPAPEEEE